MDVPYTISSPQLDEFPRSDGPYCFKMPGAQIFGGASPKYSKMKNSHDHRNFFKRYKCLCLFGLVFLILVIIAAVTLTGIVNASVLIWEKQTEEMSPSPSKPSNDENLEYEELLRIIESNAFSDLPESGKYRLKREVTRVLDDCQEKMAQCSKDVNVINLLDELRSNNQVYFEAFLKNISTANPEVQSQFLDLFDCIRCKTLESKYGDNFQKTIYENSLRHHYEHNSENPQIETVIKLLDHAKAHEDEEKIPNKIGNQETSTLVWNSISSSSPGGKNEELESSEPKIEVQETGLPESTTFRSIEDEKNIVKNLNTSEASNSEKIDNDKKENGNFNETQVENNETNGKEILEDKSIIEKVEDEALEAKKNEGFRQAGSNFNLKGRIVSNEHLQVKGHSGSGNQLMIPTAETIKSSQQLQLTPTMSWMQYPVCFYGPPSGPMKQSAPGQVIYPASSPAAPFPVSMPQQRGQAFLNSGNHGNSGGSPNYLQVQAQSVQFMQMPFPGQRVGPTGPGSFPIFPGTQSTTGTANSARGPYYCTYIPAPTFQYPAIPGVSEFQRSTVEKELDNDEDQAKPIWEVQTPLSPGFSQVCPFGKMRCEDGERCISKVQWCDGYVDCKDASDEARCSCRDRISKERLCDGYFDCPHGEDELGCFGCPRTSFSCGDWSRRYTTSNCVPLSQRCDGVKQCPNGKDELDCFILSPTYVEGKNVFTVSYAEGYLHKNLEGRWYPVCTPTESWALEACKAEVGPDMNGMPDIKIHTIPEKVYKGPYLAEVNGETKVLSSCLSRIVHVRCPPMPCGTRIFSRQESLYSLRMKDENEYSQLRNAESDENQIDTLPGDISSEMKNATSEEGESKDSMVGSQLRVVGGRASQPKAWPFLVAIYKDGYFHCGGVIVNELWILTAAHCLDEYTNHYFEVQAGVLRRFSFSPMAQSRKAKYTIIHSEYSSKNMQNDIGMIMLDEPLYFNRWIRPICLPDGNKLTGVNEPEPGSTCVAIGWGATRERGPDPDHLREVEVPILPICTHPSDQNDASICAGYPQGGRDACQGDSGGPLMCRSVSSESQWYVAGIVSHGEGCGRPNEPGAYTKVSHFARWITDVSNGQAVPSIGKYPLDRCPGFTCEGGLGKCLPIEKRCNKIVDCLDGEDEINCPRSSRYSLFRQSDNNPEIIASSSDEAVIDTSPKILNDAPSGPEYQFSGEVTEAGTGKTGTTTNENIETLDLTTPQSKNEPENIVRTTFTCTKLIQSIPITKRCDKIVDCDDGTDESNCNCRDFLLHIRPSAICNGILDCLDKTDEVDCGICKETEFLCQRSATCIPINEKCDGKYDCPLQEDELDCFALTNGKEMHLDAEGRPEFNLEGFLTRNVKGEWRATCHSSIISQNQSTLSLIGQNMCKIFGLIGLEMAYGAAVSEAALKRIPNDEESTDWHENTSKQFRENEENKVCTGLYIRCRSVLNNSLRGHLRFDRRTGSSSYQWPWLAAIFIDGTYHCSAILLNYHWLLASAKCVQDFRPDEHYMAVVLGYGPLFMFVDGPHQQISRIDEIQYVQNSVTALLHLEKSVNMTRYVQPLLLEKKIYPAAADDTCIAVGTDANFKTNSIFLHPVLDNCQSCNRCFISTSDADECLTSLNQTSDWNGVIFCHGQKGWYPAGAFYKNEEPCKFDPQVNVTNIENINPYFTQAMEDEIGTSKEPPCDGFRCSIGKCIPRNQICDGVEDCRDGTDEDTKNCEKMMEDCENSINGCTCKRSELRCGNGKCVAKDGFCDRNPNCSDGTDEPPLCSCAEYLKLTAPERLCDGIRHCLDKTDESPTTCPCRDNSFRCPSSENTVCIPQDFVCDGVADCAAGEDELQCRMIKPMDQNHPESGEVIRRSYGIWHSECFPLPIETEDQASEICKTMGFTSGTINNETIIREEPLVPIGNHFYIVKLNRWLWLTMQNNETLLELGKPEAECNRALVTCT